VAWRGQPREALGRASSRVQSASCMAGPVAERCASEAARWPSVVAHEWLSSGLTYFHATTSSPLRGARAAELSCLHTIAHAARRPHVDVHERLPWGLAYLRVDTSSPLCRLHADGAFLPLRRHAVAHQHTVDHRCLLLYVGCAQGSRLGSEKRGARK